MNDEETRSYIQRIIRQNDIMIQQLEKMIKILEQEPEYENEEQDENGKEERNTTIRRKEE